MSSIEQLEQMSKIMLKYTSKFGAHWHCLTYIGKILLKILINITIIILAFSIKQSVIVTLDSDSLHSLIIHTISRLNP